MKNKLMLPFLAFSLLLSAQKQEDQKDQKILKVISYNILQGFREDDPELKKSFMKWADSINPDVIAFQEMNGYTNEELKELGQKMGYPYTALVRETGYPPAIISKYPLKNTGKITEGLLHGFLYTQILDQHFVVLHLNPFSYKKRNEEIRIVLDQLSNVPEKESVLIMGDFNSLAPTDSLFYGKNDEKLVLMKEKELENDKIRNLNNENLDYSVIQLIIDAGYIDTWKQMHPENYTKSAPTSSMRSDPANDVRIDYIWINEAMRPRLKNSTIIKDDLSERLSDHYPMLLELKNRDGT